MKNSDIVYKYSLFNSEVKLPDSVSTTKKCLQRKFLKFQYKLAVGRVKQGLLVYTKMK